MRINLNVSDLTQEQWTVFKAAIDKNYTVPAGAVPVCVVVSYGEDDRHFEVTIRIAIAILKWLDVELPDIKAADVLTGDAAGFLPVINHLADAADPAFALTRHRVIAESVKDDHNRV